MHPDDKRRLQERAQPGVAPDEAEAVRLLGLELAKRGLRLSSDDIFMEIPLHQTAAIVLRDGDY